MYETHLLIIGPDAATVDTDAIPNFSEYYDTATLTSGEEYELIFVAATMFAHANQSGTELDIIWADRFHDFSEEQDFLVRRAARYAKLGTRVTIKTDVSYTVGAVDTVDVA